MNDACYFDKVAKEWDGMVRHDPQKNERLLKLIPLNPSARVLDVGCGTGVLVPYLLKRLPKGEIVEMDISQNMLAVAAEKFKDGRVSFVCGDAAEENESLGTFDAVIAYSMFPHFKDKQAAVCALVNKLKSGGVIGILHSMSRDALNNMHAHAEDNSVRNDIMPEMCVLKEWLIECGCNVIECIDNDEFFALAAKKK